MTALGFLQFCSWFGLANTSQDVSHKEFLSPNGLVIHHLPLFPLRFILWFALCPGRLTPRIASRDSLASVFSWAWPVTGKGKGLEGGNRRGWDTSPQLPPCFCASLCQWLRSSKTTVPAHGPVHGSTSDWAPAMPGPPLVPSGLGLLIGPTVAGLWGTQHPLMVPLAPPIPINYPFITSSSESQQNQPSSSCHNWFCQERHKNGHLLNTYCVLGASHTFFPI